MRTMQPTNHLFLLIIILASLIGCSTHARSVATESPSSTPFLQTGVALSKTPMAFATETNTRPPTETFTPLPTFTLTPLATLSQTQAQEALQQLLMKQETCLSPCFWGIMPDQTTLGEAQNIFTQLQIPLTRTSHKEKKDFYATEFGLHNNVKGAIVLRVQDGLIDSLRTNIGPVNYREWRAFSPDTILSQYGTPSYVEFYLSMAPDDGSSPYIVSYSMIMYFDSLNLTVKYASSLVKDEKLIRACPLVDKLEAGVWLGKDSDNAPTKIGIPLDRATSLTLAKFDDLLRQGSKKTACFDLSRDTFFSNP